jgi:hypothetical protein
MDQKRTSPHNVIVKMFNIQNKQIILKAVREKHQVTSTGKYIRITADLSKKL